MFSNSYFGKGRSAIFRRLNWRTTDIFTFKPCTFRPVRLKQRLAHLAFSIEGVRNIYTYILEDLCFSLYLLTIVVSS